MQIEKYCDFQRVLTTTKTIPYAAQLSLSDKNNRMTKKSGQNF